MLKVLYICSPSSIHDYKWMSYFSMQKEKYLVYALYESNHQPSIDDLRKLSEAGIILLEPVEIFSIKAPLKTLSSISTIRLHIQQYKIDIVHILFATPHALWTNFISVPYIITTRGSDILLVIPNLLKRKDLKSLYFRGLFCLFRRAFQRASAVTSTSNLQIEKIQTLFQSSSTLIRTGVSVNEIKDIMNPELLPVELQKQPFILSPRFMQPIYNIGLQIESLALLNDEFLKKYLFVFIKGKSYNKTYFEEQQQKLEKLEKDKGLKYLVIDYLSQESLWMAFKKASLTIMTPLSDGTPNSALEAMAAKCPLIIPDLNYDKDVFANATFLLKKNDSQELAQLIEVALKQNTKPLTDLAFDRVEKLGNRIIEMSRLEKIYSEIVI